MNRDFIIMQTNLLVNAPSCCDEAKQAGNEYLNALGTDKEQECLDALIKELKADIIPIDNMVAFLKTDASKLVFGEKRDFFLSHALELERNGVKYCDCPACSAGEAIIKAYEH